MFDGVVGACVDAGAAFDAFCDFFCDCFSVDEFEDFDGAGGDAFSGSFAFVVIDGDCDGSFFKFFFHRRFTSFLV